MGMSYEKGTSSHSRMNATAVGMRNERLADEEAERKVNCGIRHDDVLDNLRAQLKARFGSTVRGWRDGIDVRHVHTVSQASPLTRLDIDVRSSAADPLRGIADIDRA